MPDEKQLLSEFESLWAAADAIWTEHDTAPAFEGYVSADYRAVYQSLIPHQHQGLNFLEWGSGLGVVSIMASRMGFSAFGIESESELVGRSQTLAADYGSAAKFAHGSFIPDAFEWILEDGDEAERTKIDLPDGYKDLDLDLIDFDLIYAYPWPTEHGLFRKIVREYGRPDSLLLTYDVREGIELIRFN